MWAIFFMAAFFIDFSSYKYLGNSSAIHVSSQAAHSNWETKMKLSGIFRHRKNSSAESSRKAMHGLADMRPSGNMRGCQALVWYVELDS